MYKKLVVLLIVEFLLSELHSVRFGDSCLSAYSDKVMCQATVKVSKDKYIPDWFSRIVGSGCQCHARGYDVSNTD